MNIFVLQFREKSTFKHLIRLFHRFNIQSMNITDMDDTYIKIKGASNNNDAYIEIQLSKDIFIDTYIDNTVPNNINVKRLYDMDTVQCDSFEDFDALTLTYHKNDKNEYLLNVNANPYFIDTDKNEYLLNVNVNMNPYCTQINMTEHQMTFNTQPINLPNVAFNESYALINISELNNICEKCKPLGLNNIKMSIFNYGLKFESIDANVQYEEFYDNIPIHYDLDGPNISGIYDVNYLIALSETNFNSNTRMYMSNNSDLIIVNESEMGLGTLLICQTGTTIDKYIETDSNNKCDYKCDYKYDYDYDNIDIVI
ncbi:MAG: hypothetical protein Homavirus16_6 [Homavirus sp.]|uniref:Uncharacterized protein n=1 Tax=Homavirus sp. TaxID=2487769 RepID=A0A3G5A4S0_9VIRU|nr:MAG: hypothetical protein Homavirus16_6 [Homavirus sp.]